MLVAVAMAYALVHWAAPTAVQLQSESTFGMAAGLKWERCSTN
jgi:hypothetical protein